MSYPESFVFWQSGKHMRPFNDFMYSDTCLYSWLALYIWLLGMFLEFVTRILFVVAYAYLTFCGFFKIRDMPLFIISSGHVTFCCFYCIRDIPLLIIASGCMTFFDFFKIRDMPLFIISSGPVTFCGFFCIRDISKTHCSPEYLTFLQFLFICDMNCCTCAESVYAESAIPEEWWQNDCLQCKFVYDIIAFFSNPRHCWCLKEDFVSDFLL